MRQSIRNAALRESKLLDSIGTAQMEQEIQKRVLALSKQNRDRMAEETGIGSSLFQTRIRNRIWSKLSKKSRNEGQVPIMWTIPNRNAKYWSMKTNVTQSIVWRPV